MPIITCVKVTAMRGFCSMEKLTSFGFLAEKIHLKFGSYEIKPLDNYDKIISGVTQSCFIKENFIYPQCDQSMFKFFGTHVLLGKSLKNSCKAKIADLENSEPFLILQFVSYLYGMRIMPENLWYDGKLPIKSQNHVFVAHKKTAEKALKVALENWKKMTKKKRAKIIDMLMMHSRIPSCHWAFEKLIWEYGLFECCYDWLCPNKKKEEFRDMNRLLDCYKITHDKKDEEWAVRIRKTRNSLVHEQKWYHQMLQGKPDDSDYTGTHSLHRLNHRLLGLCLGFSGGYFESNWRSIGQMGFEFDEK